MSNEEITEIIKEAEWQQQSFHRVSGKLSERMIEALKQVHKYDIIGVVSKCCNAMCDEPVHKEGSVYCVVCKGL